MEWVAIEGYKYPYRISETGRVQKFDKGEWIDLAANLHHSTRRVEINLRRADGTLHRPALTHLMAEAFMGGRRPGCYIIHKNGMKTDCAVENLMFSTKKETGKKYGHLARRKAVLKVDNAGNLLDVYCCADEAAKKNFISASSVRRRCRGIVKDHFKYTDFTFCYDN